MSDLIKFLAGLRMTGGDRDGEAFTVLPWEQTIRGRGAFRVKGPAALSVTRGNGKSALVAGIATAVVDPTGPLTWQPPGGRRGGVQLRSIAHHLRGRSGIPAGSRPRPGQPPLVEAPGQREQGAGGVPPDRRQGPHHRIGPGQGAWSAAGPGATGRAGTVGSGDKPRRMLAAIKTGMGKVPNSKMIALGTRPADDAHWFSRMLNGGADYSQCHAAGVDDPPFQRRTWAKANPSLSILPSLEAEIRDEAAAARSDPSMLAAFQALRLNMGMSDVMQSHVCLDVGTWTQDRRGGAPGGAVCVGRRPGNVCGHVGCCRILARDSAGWKSCPPSRMNRRCPSAVCAMGSGRLYADGWKRGELIQVGGEAVSITGLLEAATRPLRAPLGAGERSLARG